MSRSGKKTKAQLRRSIGELYATFEWPYKGPDTALRAFETAFSARKLSLWRYHVPADAPRITRITVLGERARQERFDEAVDALRRFGGKDVTGTEGTLLETLRERRRGHVGKPATTTRWPAGAYMDRAGRIYPRVREKGSTHE